MAPLENELRAGLRALGLEATDAQVDRLLQFAELMRKWTGVYNLTALRSPHDVLTHHILDCAAAAASLNRRWEGKAVRVLDVGSGGGLPGAVIAILNPNAAVDCIDAVAKKAAFVQQVSSTLRLANLRAIHGRVEQVHGHYDVVASRAFASLPDFVRLTQQALAEGGSWMAMKGKYPADEIAGLPPEVEVFHVEQLQVPGLKAERCVIWLRRRVR